MNCGRKKSLEESPTTSKLRIPLSNKPHAARASVTPQEGRGGESKVFHEGEGSHHHAIIQNWKLHPFCEEKRRGL